MEGTKYYVNLIEIGPVVIKIQQVENDELVVPAQIIHVCTTRLSWPLTHDRVYLYKYIYIY